MFPLYPTSHALEWSAQTLAPEALSKSSPPPAWGQRPHALLLLHHPHALSLGFPFGTPLYHNRPSRRLRNHFFCRRKVLGPGSPSCPKWRECLLQKRYLWQPSLLTQRELPDCNQYFLTSMKGFQWLSALGICQRLCWVISCCIWEGTGWGGQSTTLGVK